VRNHHTWSGLDIGVDVAHDKRYEIVSAIGEGGMGVIYRAYDASLERDVAIKMLKPEVPRAERRRFRREALMGARFCHPGFVRVFDYAQEKDGREWFAMEYLPGRDLSVIVRRALERDHSFPARLIADTFRQVLNALQYMHDCRVVHRDVKPENMFVTRDRNTRFVTTKLLDLGVALEIDEEHREAMFVGDPRYMAPEQASDGIGVDGRADLYATGIALYEAVSGHHPFAAGIGPNATAWAWVDAHLDAPLPAFDSDAIAVPAKVAKGLERVIQTACAKRPNDRFDSARAMQTALFAALQGAC
jgi:serine/threonine-protein kinase